MAKKWLYKVSPAIITNHMLVERYMNYFSSQRYSCFNIIIEINIA